jgi:hypothetical protein
VEVEPVQRPSAEVAVGCGREATLLSLYPPPQAAGANPLLKQLAKLPQATSPFIKPEGQKALKTVVPVMRMGVTRQQHAGGSPLSQDNRKIIPPQIGTPVLLETRLATGRCRDA